MARISALAIGLLLTGCGGVTVESATQRSLSLVHPVAQEQQQLADMAEQHCRQYGLHAQLRGQQGINAFNSRTVFHCVP